MYKFICVKIIFAIILINSFLSYAQNSSLTGKVIKEDGKPAELVNVGLKGTTIGAVTNSDGEFKISNINPGSYTVVFSFVGYETKEVNVEVKANKNLAIETIVLKEVAREIDAVLVKGNKPIDLSSDYVAKIPLPNLDNPQVYNVVNSELLKMQNIKNFDYALNNVPGIYKLWESTGRGYGDGAAYYSLRGFETQATIINGVAGLTNGNLDPANIEKIEVIKGPSGTLFGSTLISYGGLINTITKRPYETFGGEISYTSGSFGLNRITADVNIPLSESPNTKLRINSAYHSENSFQDAGFKKSLFFAPAFSYKANDRLSFLINAEFLQAESTNPVMLFLNRSSKLEYKDVADLNYNTNLSLTSNDLSIKNPFYNLQAFINYKISGNWKSQTIMSRGKTGSEGYYSYLWDDNLSTRQFTLYISDQNASTITTDIQQNFTGDFNISNVKNKLLIGFDYFDRLITDNSSGYAFVHNVTPQGDINYINHYSGDTLATRYLSRQSVDDLLSNSGIANSNSADRTYSIYISDVANVLQNLIAMAGVRVDYFDSEGDIYNDEDNYNQAAFSPKFGLIYQPLPETISLFANYQNGFKNIAPIQVTDADGSNPQIKSFKPEKANQYEFGIKTELLSKTISATISYYNIKVDNVVISDPQNIYNSIQGGKVESKGFEFEIIANPVSGLNISGGISYNQSKILKGDPSGIWFQEGKRPVSAGPKNIYNLWTTYQLPEGLLNGFGFGFGLNSSSELLVLDSDVTGRFVLPSYTIFNGSVFYNYNKIFITLNLNNISNVKYYKGYSTINPQEPRNYVLTLSFKI